MRPGTRKALLAGAIVIVLALVGLAVALSKMARTERVQVDDAVVAVLGGGGNSAILVTKEGSVVVDTKLSLPAGALFEEAKRLGGGKIRALINTHHHWDHTHGNPDYPPGTEVYAAVPVAGYMQRFDGDFWKRAPAKDLLPNQTVGGERTVDFGDERVRLVQLPPAHTGGGDLGVLFEKHRVLCAGDVFFNGVYPAIDLEAGGSVAGYIKAIDRLLELPFDKVIPGHGPVATRADLQADRAYYMALWVHAVRAVHEHLTLEQALEKAPEQLRHREELPLFSSLKKNLQWAMEEAARGMTTPSDTTR